MADERNRSAVFIVNGSTPTTLAGVEALADAASNPTALSVGAYLMGFDGTSWDRIYAVADGDTVAAGTKGFTILGTDGTNYQVLSTNSSGHINIADGGNAITVDGTVTAELSATDNAVLDQIELNLDYGVVVGGGAEATALRVTIANDSTGVLSVDDGGSSLTVDNGGTFAVQVDGDALTALQLIDDAVYTDGTGTPSKGLAVMGSDGTNPQFVTTDSDGHLQVDILTGASDNTPTNPTIDLDSSSGTAAGASANLDSAEITEAEKLQQVDISSSVPWKATIQKVEDDSATSIAVMFGRAGELVTWRPPHRDYVTHAGSSAGTDVFRVVWVNMDASEAADGYASFYYST